MANESSARNIIGQGTRIKGEIELNGDFRIDGQIIGFIKSSGKVVVGATGLVEGDLVCQNADISGSVKGKLIAEELVALKASGKFDGELVTSRISIEVGASFNGKCEMIDTPDKGNDKKKS